MTSLSLLTGRTVPPWHSWMTNCFLFDIVSALEVNPCELPVHQLTVFAKPCLLYCVLFYIKIFEWDRKKYVECADPESFVRGDPALTAVFFL